MSNEQLIVARNGLKEFLNQEFFDYETATKYAQQKGWERVLDAEDRENGAPKGKLAFEEFDTWFVPDDTFVRASWSSFILPGNDGPLGTMNVNEAWTTAGDERFWFDLGVELFDSDPLGKREEVPNIFSWNWGYDPEPKGSNFSAFRFVPLGEDVTKFSYIRTHATPTPRV